MSLIKCTLPNASELINGVKFALVGGDLVSEDVADDVAAHFISIPGYELVPAPVIDPVVDPAADPAQSAPAAKAKK